MQVEVSQKPLPEVDADLTVVLLFKDEELPQELLGARGAEDARSAYRKSTLVHPESPERVLVVGMGKHDELDPERIRVAAAVAAKQAAGLRATSLAIAVPEGGDEELAAALVEGALMAAYRFDRFKTDADPEEEGEQASPPRIESLTLIGDPKLAERAEVARVTAEAANRARELQNLPSNVATPTYLAERALEIASMHDAVSVEVIEREEMVERGMGGLEAVSAGTDQPPKLIVMRIEGEGPLLALVGKAVTFDSGGISIKPSGGMQEMKMDMSGGAAVIEAVAAIAELGTPANLLAVVPATENMPSGHATKPGDIITQLNGKTVEVNNTDAEGRLILADALAYAVEGGAERLVDLATLTGAVLIALGSTYAALVSNDDVFAAEVAEAAERTGELAWRLPLHPEYKELTKGTVADLTNAS